MLIPRMHRVFTVRAPRIIWYSNRPASEQRDGEPFVFVIHCAFLWARIISSGLVRLRPANAVFPTSRVTSKVLERMALVIIFTVVLPALVVGVSTYCLYLTKGVERR